MPTRTFFWRYRLLIILFICLAFLVRVQGVDFGLPYKFHPDEHKYVEPALSWHTSGEMDLELINPPLFTYVLWTAYWLWFTLVPFIPSEQWLTNAYFFARLWSVFFSVLTVALVYVVGKRLHGPKTGLVAVILMFGLFLPAREAHFAVNDSAVTFFVLLAIYFCLRLLQNNRLPTYIAAGICVGLATAAKLTGGLVALALLLAHILLKKRNHFYFGLSLSIALVTFLLVAAHIFWKLPLFIEAINEHLAFGEVGYKGLQMTPVAGWLFYGYVLGWGVGWLMLVTICLALIGAIIHPSRQTAVLTIFSIALFIYMGAQEIVFARFLLPAIPPLVVLAAHHLVRLEKRWSLWQKYPTVIWSLIIIMLLAQPLLSLVWFSHLLTLADTRELATEWFTNEFPQDTTVVRESYSLLPNTVFLDKDWPYEIDTLSTSRQMKNGENHYLAHDAGIVVLSNFTSGRIRANPTEEEMRLKQLAVLDNRATLIKEFNPYQPGYEGRFYLDELYGPAGETLQRIRPGPLIRVYRIE